MIFKKRPINCTEYYTESPQTGDGSFQQRRLW